MTLAIPRQSPVAAQAAPAFALFLTNGANQWPFAEQAKVLPSSPQALGQLRAQLGGATPANPQEALVQRARLLYRRQPWGAPPCWCPPAPG
jgi:putative chitobiose transport system substrate-binding protein